MRRSADEDAPALAESLIDAIDLEPDHGFRLEEVGLRHICTEDHLLARELEVDGQRNGPPLSREDDSADAPGSQMRVTLLPRQNFERWMVACSSLPGCAVDIASGKSGRGRVQNERDEIQGSEAQAGVCGPLEVLEICRIDAGTPGQLLGGEAELTSAMGDPAGQVTRVGRAGGGFSALESAAGGTSPWVLGVMGAIVSRQLGIV